MPDLDGQSRYRKIAERWPEHVTGVVFITGDILPPALRSLLPKTGPLAAALPALWEVYLVGSKVAFDLRSSQLWQLVLSPRGVPGGYLVRVD